jgi:hypothetical protein
MKHLKKLYTPEMQHAAQIAAAPVASASNFWEDFLKQIPRDKKAPLVEPRKLKDH